MNKQWLTLGIALGMPLLLIAVVAGSIKISEMRVSPAYDVLYATGYGYAGKYYYVQGTHISSDIVDESGQMIKKGQSATNDYSYTNQQESVNQTRFYRYDPVTDSSSSVGGYADARKLDIISIDKSPDGYRVIRGTDSGDAFFFPFFYDGGRNTTGFVIEGENGRKNIRLTGDDYYRTDIIGWIEK
ncbi:MAG: hypothetical protein G01um10148_191 [Parcubacteria group bacterium Gr01-1014_8]|nr:MAG: hypothetical protein G01um10148_191 [Parcubacteria group bacterium Gr01-1014_8]